MKNKNENSRIVMNEENANNNTANLERERENYSDYLYQNTAEFNISELNKRQLMKDKEEFLQDALAENEKQKMVKIESFDRYKLVADRITEYFGVLDKTNSSLTVDDLCVQAHLILLPDKFVDPSDIKVIITKVLKDVWSNVKNGKVIMINNNLLFDSLKFGDKIVPICVVNAKLIPAKYIVNFLSLDLVENYDVLGAFATILENALNSRFYVRLDDDIILLRKGKINEEQNQLFISEHSLKNNFSKIQTRERSKEIYDKINLEDVVSNKTSGVISFNKKEKVAENGKVKEPKINEAESIDSIEEFLSNIESDSDIVVEPKISSGDIIEPENSIDDLMERQGLIEDALKNRISEEQILENKKNLINTKVRKTSKSASGKTIKTTIKKDSKPAAKKTTKPAAKKSTKPATKKTTKPAAKKTTKPATKKSTKPAAKKTTKPAVKKSTKPKTSIKKTNKTQTLVKKTTKPAAKKTGKE